MGQGVRLDVPRAAFGWATAYVLKDQCLRFDGPSLCFDGPMPTFWWAKAYVLMGQGLRFDGPRPTF